MRRPLLVLALVTLAACKAHPYYGTATVTDQAGDPSAQIDPNGSIRIAEGSAASAHIEFNSLTGGTMNGGITSNSPDVLTILPTPHDGNTYVFLGRKAGLAEVVVTTNNVPVRSIYAVVTSPPFGSSGDAGVGDAGVGDAAGGDAGEEDAGASHDGAAADGEAPDADVSDAAEADAADGDANL